jgi:NAD(P)-dependent dehydrogenase (short-subunit alcohol dehydrogenase family)
MTKFAAVALSHATRRAGWTDGVRCTALCPGFVATDMTADVTTFPHEQNSVRGASQRIAEVGIFAWLAAASWFVLRHGVTGVEWNGREESGDGPMR